MIVLKNNARIFLLLVALIAIACCKKAGYGGDASIRGYVHVLHFNSTFTQYISQYPGKDLYVYVVYGNHPGYDKRIKTDYNGNFEFPYLYKGDYKVYVYSRDSTFTDPSGMVAVVRNISITSRKEVYNTDTLKVFQ